MEKVFLVVAAAMGGLAVALGAFGAHGLKDVITEARLGTFETAVRYQMYHALALFAVVGLMRWTPSPLLGWAGWLLIAGVLIFSGSLYLLIMTDASWLGAITPIGGVAMIAGWLLMLVAALRS
jgi:uncharacterized membrane protein YgdD (TMEM256/DUF423 family)